MYRMLIINPGSTSTKIAVYDDLNQVFGETLNHSNEELAAFDKIFSQYDFRKNAIIDSLKQRDIDIKTLSAVVGRGGDMRPIESGTYKVNDQMIDDLKTKATRQHASNLGAVIAAEIGNSCNIPAFVVDPVVVDEMDDIARISGMADIKRTSIFHALNQKAVAKRYAKETGKAYESMNLIVAHLGGGISVGAHRKGRVVDVDDAFDGDAPFSPERSGGLPVGALVKMCYSGEYSFAEMKRKIVGAGGLVSYLNTNDARNVEAMIEDGNKEAALVYEAMAYQVAKHIGMYATVLKGEVDAIILTGGIAYSAKMVDWIKERVAFIADVVVSPGEDEMRALAEGGLRVLTGEEVAKEY